MAWTEILSSQTDADSPLNQVLFDAIRGDLDDLKDTISATAYQTIGGVATASGSFPALPDPVDITAGNYVQVGFANYPTPPSGKKYAIQLSGKALRLAANAEIWLYRCDLDDNPVAIQASAKSGVLGASAAAYSLIHYELVAFGGRFILKAQTNTAEVCSGILRLYLVDA